MNFLLYALMSSSLSIQDEQDLLIEIDTLCGDTWCESNSDYTFKAFKCDFNVQTCVMTFDVIPWGMACNKSLCPRVEKQCVVHSISSSKHLFTRKNKLVSINRGFYARLGDCVNRVSEETYHRLKSPC